MLTRITRIVQAKEEKGKCHLLFKRIADVHEYDIKDCQNHVIGR